MVRGRVLACILYPVSCILYPVLLRCTHASFPDRHLTSDPNPNPNPNPSSNLKWGLASPCTPNPKNVILTLTLTRALLPAWCELNLLNQVTNGGQRTFGSMALMSRHQQLGLIVSDSSRGTLRDHRSAWHAQAPWGHRISHCCAATRGM